MVTYATLPATTAHARPAILSAVPASFSSIIDTDSADAGAESSSFGVKKFHLQLTQLRLVLVDRMVVFFE